MTESTDPDRAAMLAEMAPHRSVTERILDGRTEEFPDGRTHEPPITYLEDAEAPAYVMTNAKRGVGLGSKRNRVEPADGRGTVIVVTGRRTLCLVGGRTEDKLIEVSHESVTGVSSHTGLLANRFVVETAEQTRHCWVNRSARPSLLEGAREFVRDRAAGTSAGRESSD